MRIDLRSDTRYLNKAGEAVELRAREGWEEGEMCPYVDEGRLHYNEDGSCLIWHGALERFVPSHSPRDDLRCSERESKALPARAAEALREVSSNLAGERSRIEELLTGIDEKALTERQERDAVDALRDASEWLDDLRGRVLKSLSTLD